jgi:Ca2+-binding RTX toxin-like protein
MPIFTGTTLADTLVGGAAADTLSGLDSNDLLLGGGGNDLLDGGLGNDTMVGGAGNDLYLINSLFDRAVELAGGGVDTIRSALAINLAQPWAAQVEALVYTGLSAAVLTGNDLDNRIVGGVNADTLRGGAGNDTLDGGSGTGADRLEGGTGDDVYILGAGDVVVELADEGRDAIQGAVTSLGANIESLFYTGAAAALAGNALDNILAGGTGNDTLAGGDGNDSLAGGLGLDRVEGQAGDDVLTGARLAATAWGALVTDGVADTLLGGTGDDTYLLTDAADVVVEAAGEGARDVIVASLDTALALHANVEALLLAEGSAARIGGGSTGNDIILGNAGDNVIAGGLGADTLAGWGLAGPSAGASDVLDGGDGADVLLAVTFGAIAAAGVTFQGGTGNDVYVLGSAGLAATGGDAGGLDVAVLLASADLSQMEGVERIILAGATAGLLAFDRAALATAQGAVAAVHGLLANGQDFAGPAGPALDATGTAGANAIIGNGGANRLAGGGGNDVLTGAGGSDTLRGEAGDDSLLGGLGHDTLDGGAGLDRMAGGLGNDVYFAEGGDIVTEAADAGFDILHSATITSLAAFANVEGLQYLGTAAVSLDAEDGNITANFFGGGAGDDSLSGRGGNDTLDGGAGHDLLNGDAGNDSLAGGLGDDRLFGGASDDDLSGGAGHDLLEGGANWDTLRGGAGNDVLRGGDGRDSLLGEAGADLLDGGDNNDVLVGGTGNDTLLAGGYDRGAPGGTDGDILFGDAPGAAWGAADTFVLDSFSVAGAVVETSVGSGVFVFDAAPLLADFQPGLDRILLNRQLVGDLDAVFDGVVTASAAGAFSAAAELVFFRTPLATVLVQDPASGFEAIPWAAVDAVIGPATAAMALNSTRVLVLTDGDSSAILLAQSADGDAQLTADEVFLLGVVANLPEALATDFGLF